MAQLIIALDINEPARAMAVAKGLCGTVKWFKVGLELFVCAGPGILESLKLLGNDIRIFLDLKFYDIPNTAANAAAAAARYGVDMLTIHCQGGERMCKAVREKVGEAGPNTPLLLGVTALTSFGPGEMPGITSHPVQFGQELAARAAGWGLDGVICSGREARGIKKSQPCLITVCPGIRPDWSGRGDQNRIVTPGEAVYAGADFLVVGRPVTKSAEPGRAAAAILEEMERAERACQA